LIARDRVDVRRSIKPEPYLPRVHRRWKARPRTVRIAYYHRYNSHRTLQHAHTRRRYRDACRVRGGEIEQYRAKSYIGAPRPTKMGNIASPWRYDAAASHARAPLKLPIAYDLALRPRAAIFQCHGRLGWALIHPRNRVYVGCRRKPGGQISAPSRLLLTRREVLAK
jgi:hypothetical protein